jgi:hypothetical protein
MTGAASSVTSAQATLNATVNPNAAEVTECKFEYGTTTSYGQSAPCMPSPGSGTSPVAVSASVTGLSPNTTYHFRISATSSGGTSKGSDQTFNALTASHYRANALLVGAEPVPVVAWGTLALKIVGGEVICHTAQAGTIDNPVGGAVGVGSTQVFATFDCESTTCPFTRVVTAESLPWGSELRGEGPIRSSTTGVKLKSDCEKGGKSEGSETFVGGNHPVFHTGTSALHPGFLEFDPGAGALEREGSKGGVLAKIEGEVKILGYDEEELINVKNP